MAGSIQSQLMKTLIRVSQPTCLEPVIGFFTRRYIVVGCRPNLMIIRLSSCRYMGLRDTESRSSAHIS